MKMDIEELFKKNFDFKFMAVTYNNMKVALRAFEEFKMDNKKFFTFEKKETLYGHLRTYSIEKQFNDSAFNSTANYSVQMKKVNTFGYKAIFVNTEDFILNLGRTNSEIKLLPPSKYKKEYAKGNAGLGNQLSFDLESDLGKVSEEKKYGEIIYGYKYGDMTHLNIILPSSDYKKIEYSSDLLANIEVYDNYLPKDLVEESIVSLKEKLIERAEYIG